MKRWIYFNEYEHFYSILIGLFLMKVKGINYYVRVKFICHALTIFENSEINSNIHRMAIK